MISSLQTVAESVRDGGKVFVYGVFSGWDVTLSTRDLMRGVQVSFWMLPTYMASVEKRVHVSAEVMELLEEMVLTPLGRKKFPLADFLAAIEESEKESHGGNLVFLIS